MQCCLDNPGQAPCSCPYHEFLRSCPPVSGSVLKEVERRYRLLRAQQVGNEGTGLQRCDQMQRLSSASALPGEAQVSRFLRILFELILPAPWSNMVFHVNRMMILRLAASFLPLIVGRATAAQYGKELRSLLSVDVDDLSSSALCWVTNRQQGKTTSTAQFLAALALTSRQGGNLVYIYSTSRDRAIEVLRAAKAYIYHALSLKSQLCADVRVVRDTESILVLQSGSTTRTIAARPKAVESCRGDAPHAAIVDEVAFVTQRFFDDFLRPLFAVRGRCFALITTPAPPGSFFDMFCSSIRTANEKTGDMLWKVVNHSLVCDECAANGVGHRCCHRLTYVPPWKSVLRFQSMYRLVPAKDRANFATEVLGVMKQNSDGYLPRALLAPVFSAEKKPCPRNVNRLWVALDPASHFKSSMGLCAVVMDNITAGGGLVVCGVASVQLSRASIENVQQIIETFLARLRRIPGLDTALLTPIIETNGSEVVAHSLLSSFRKYGPTSVPWTKDLFPTGVTESVGVLTTRETKLAALSTAHSYLVDNTLRIAADCVTVDARIYQPQALPQTTEEMLEILQEQLAEIRDQPDGTVSGKGPTKMLDDDAAIALLLSIYWRKSALAVEASSKR